MLPSPVPIIAVHDLHIISSIGTGKGVISNGLAPVISRRELEGGGSPRGSLATTLDLGALGALLDRWAESGRRGFDARSRVWRRALT
jgi:hypothetical protein